MRAVVAAFPQGTAGGQYLHARNVQCATWHAAVQQADRRETSMRLMMRAVGVQKAQAQEAHANIDV